MSQAGAGEVKSCRTCKVEKPLSDFSPKQKATRSAQCRACASEIHRRWVAENPERVRELRAAYFNRNPDKVRALDRARRRRSPELQTWKRMMARCYNPNVERYPNYGGRGIRVADEWHGKEGFLRFLEHVGPRPSPSHSIDRYPDTNGHYEPGNVRWATTAEQARNTTKNKFVELDGEKLCLRDAAKHLGMTDTALGHRLLRGMPPEEAVTKPPRPRERLITVDGVTKSALEWSRALGGNDSLVAGRIWAGWDEVDAASTPIGVRSRWNRGAA